jgi:HK97 family phage major capsid protein
MNNYRYSFDRKRIPIEGIKKILCVLPILLGICGFAMASAFDVSTTEHAQAGLGLNSALALGGYAWGNQLREEFDDGQGGGGGAALDEKEFQGKVLGGLKEQKATVDDLVKNFDGLDKKTKGLFEDFTKQKDEFEGFTGQVKKIEHTFKKLQLQLKNEQRLANGDPVKRMLADEDTRTLLNAKIRKAAGVRLSEKHEKAITSGSTPGSTYIDDELDTEIYDTLATYGIWNTFDVKTVSTRNNKFLVKTARPTAGFFGEGVTITEDTAKAGTSVTAEAKGIKVVLSVPIELLEDSEVDITADVMNDFLEAISYRMDWACLQANGGADSTDGGFNGIFDAGTAAVAASGNVSVETLGFEDVTGAMLAVDEGVLSRDSRWWMHPRQLIRMLHIKDSNGRPIFLTAMEAPTPAGIGSILGSAVVPSFAAPTANTTSSDIAVFGDPKGGVAALRKGIEFAESRDSKFEDYEATFRGIGRFGFEIRDAGAFAVLTTAAS